MLKYQTILSSKLFVDFEHNLQEITEAVGGRFSIKKVSLNFLQIHKKTTVLNSLFKKRLQQV